MKIQAKSAYSATEVTFQDRSVRLARPASTAPGPHSMNSPTPRATASRMQSSHSTLETTCFASRFGDVHALKERGKALACGFHQPAVVGAGHLERHHHAELAARLGRLDRAGHLIRIPGNDNLPGAVQIRHVHVVLGAKRLHRRSLAADHRGHRPVRRVACFLHQPPALRHDPQAVGERKGARRRERGELAEAQSGRQSDPLQLAGFPQQGMQGITMDV